MAIGNTQVETFAGHNRTVSVTKALGDLCGQARFESRGGFHVSCNSQDDAKQEAMQPNFSYCVLHALMAQRIGKNEASMVFECPAGLTASQILGIEEKIRS